MGLFGDHRATPAGAQRPTGGSEAAASHVPSPATARPAGRPFGMGTEVTIAHPQGQGLTGAVDQDLRNVSGQKERGTRGTHGMWSLSASWALPHTPCATRLCACASSVQTAAAGTTQSRAYAAMHAGRCCAHSLASALLKASNLHLGCTAPGPQQRAPGAPARPPSRPPVDKGHDRANSSVPAATMNATKSRTLTASVVCPSPPLQRTHRRACATRWKQASATSSASLQKRSAALRPSRRSC